LFFIDDRNLGPVERKENGYFSKAGNEFGEAEISSVKVNLTVK